MMLKFIGVQLVKRFLGMVNYFLKFLLYLFIVMELLRCLEDKDVEWYWNEVYERVFIDVK